MPLLYQDDFGFALVFDNKDNIETLSKTIADMDTAQYKSCILLLIENVILLYDNGFIYEDFHFDNILYKDDKVYFIDMKYLKNVDSSSTIIYHRILRYLEKLLSMDYYIHITSKLPDPQLFT
jgi:RIO-like serine/threonine protein kinase